MEFQLPPLVDPRYALSGGPPLRDEAMLAAALAADVTLFRGENDVPTVRLPDVAGVWPLRSPRVRAWLAKVCWSACNQLPRPRELDAVLLVLEHEAWSSPQILPPLHGEGRGGVGRDAERCSKAVDNGDSQAAASDSDDASEPDRLWAAVESDPVTAAVVELAALGPSWEGRMCDLLERLTNLAVLRKLIEPSPARRGSPGRGADERNPPWPRIAGALGAHLRRQSGLIERAGVRIEITRTNRGSQVRLTNVAPLPADEPPPEHETAADSSLGDDQCASSPHVPQESSSPRNLLDTNDLPPDHGDRPQPGLWPSSPLNRRKGKHLSQNGDDRDDRIGKKRTAPAAARRPVETQPPTPQPPPAGCGKKTPHRPREP